MHSEEELELIIDDAEQSMNKAISHLEAELVKYAQVRRTRT